MVYWILNNATNFLQRTTDSSATRRMNQQSYFCGLRHEKVPVDFILLYLPLLRS